MRGQHYTVRVRLYQERRYPTRGSRFRRLPDSRVRVGMVGSRVAMNHDIQRLGKVANEADAILGFRWVICRIVQLPFPLPPGFCHWHISTHTDASDGHIFSLTTHNVGYIHTISIRSARTSRCTSVPLGRRTPERRLVCTCFGDVRKRIPLWASPPCKLSTLGRGVWRKLKISQE